MVTTQIPNKILLVEDNEADAKMVRIHLLEAGMRHWQLDTCTSLSDALKALHEQRYAAVLLDLSLPDSRGIETLEKLAGSFPDNNIIVMTGFDDNELGIQTVKAGAQDFLVKGSYTSGDLAKSLRYSIERRRITQSLEETQRIAHIGNLEFDLKSKVLTYSDESANILGIPPKVMEMNMVELGQWFAAEDLNMAIELCGDAIQKGEVRTDVRFVRPTDGQTRTLFTLIRAVRSEEGKMVRLSGVIQDITDRKLAEQEMLKSRERYRIIFSQSKDAIYISTRQGLMVDFNEAAVQLFGYAKEELALLNARELYLHPAERATLVQLIERSDFVQDFAVEIRRKNGEVRQCLITATRLQTEDFDGYHGIVRDITERRQADELRRAKELAEKASAMKEQFLANVSHEIRTPMNAILGMTHLLLKTPLDQDQFTFVDAIRQASGNLVKIINDILEISQIQSGQIQLEEKVLNPAELVRSAVQILRFKAAEKSLEILAEIDPAAETELLGDPTRLNQILLNLVNNAIKFTDQGRIFIRVNKENETEDFVFLTFEVEDTGEGIAEEKLPAIFDMFIQVSDDLNKKQGGSGLGLAIVRQLAELQGGRVDVRSQKGQGSVFTVRLPLRKPDNAPGETVGEAPISMPQRPLRILLAEDQKMNQIVAKKIIEGEWPNIQVVIANNGREAVDYLYDQHFDLILMDIQMPEMDGYEATHFIRNHFGAPKSNIPILAMTAHAFISKEEKYKDYGMDDFVLKPFDPKQLFRKIAQHLEAPMQPIAPDPQIDLSYLELMSDGDAEIKATLLGMLLEEPLEEIALMKSQAASSHWDELKKTSHKMKSTLAFVGCAPLTEANREVERRCMEHDALEGVRALVAQVETIFLQIQPQLKAEFEQIGGK